MRSCGENERFGRVCLALISAALLVIAAASVLVGLTDGANDVNSFSEPVAELSGGWTLTDSAGVSSSVALPCTLEYGADGVYTLETVLAAHPEVIAAPALGFYSNYTDVKIYLDGALLLSYPNAAPAYIAGTGNTWQFVRLPADFAGRTLRLELRCQLGNRITYAVRPLLLGAKATMLNDALLTSVPSLVLASCLAALALMLAVMYFVLRRRLALNRSTLFLALFAAVFAAYVYCESAYARMSLPNGHVLYYCTFAFLALMPAPLVCFLGCSLEKKYGAVPLALALASLANTLVQTALHFTGTANVRVMLPVTHGVIVVSIALMAAFLLLTDRKKCPDARKKLFSSLPIMAGGCADILLLALGHPSYNNSLWLVLGVAVFILIQFVVFLGSYFTIYRRAVEAEVLREMAFRDELTGIGNRNAYERRLKELGAGPVPEGLCCIVADINDLKRINDVCGHTSGDAAIKAGGAVLSAMVPPGGQAFRTGGDEFVVLLEGMEEAGVRGLAAALAAEAAARGEKLGIPLELATGSGRYSADDGNIQDFIRRVDTLMYENKRRIKSGG